MATVRRQARVQRAGKHKKLAPYLKYGKGLFVAHTCIKKRTQVPIFYIPSPTVDTGHIAL